MKGSEVRIDTINRNNKMSGFNKVNNMEACIDIRTLADNVPSLCIPRVFPNITETRIRKVINDLNMGDIERIDMVSKTTEKGEKFNRVFIHFRKWASDGNAAIARERLVNGKEIKIVYDEPWFWKVSAYRKDAPKTREPHKSAPRQHEVKKPSFCFESQEQDNNQSRTQYQNQYQYQNQNQNQNQYQSKYQNKYQSKYQNKRPAPPKERKVVLPRSPSSSPPPMSPLPPPTSPTPIQDVVEGPTGEYLDVPKVEYGKIAFPKRKGLKTKVVLTIVNPDEITLD
jgi:hypothetical protein